MMLQANLKAPRPRSPGRGTVAQAALLALGLGLPQSLAATPPPGGDAPGATQCQGWGPGELSANIATDAVSESSGLAASHRTPGILWTHNDSGDTARLFALRADGTLVTEVRLPGIAAEDWEDMAIGPCEPQSSRSCVFVGDIGDNARARAHVTIHRFEEPALGPNPPPLLEVQQVATLRLRYPEGPRDAEALLAHPLTGDLYIVEKSDEGRSNVYRLPLAFDGQMHDAELVTTLQFDNAIRFGRTITAGDFAPGGNELTLRTYLNLYTFCGTSSAPDDLFRGTPQVSPMPWATFQAEALTYARDEDALWITSERRPSPLVRVPRASSPAEQEPSPLPQAPQTDAGPNQAPPDAGPGLPPEPPTPPQDTPPPQEPPASAPRAPSQGCACAQVPTPASGHATSLAFLGLLGLGARLWRSRQHRRAAPR